MKEHRQAGTFNYDFVLNVSEVLKKNNLMLKEHNCDYLSAEDVSLRKDIVDAMNIAPQLGVVQTSCVLNKCLIYSVDTTDFLNLVYEAKKWQKWISREGNEIKYSIALAAGHYHFASAEFQRIMEKLHRYEDVDKEVIHAVMKVIDHYESSSSTK